MPIIKVSEEVIEKLRVIGGGSANKGVELLTEKAFLLDDDQAVIVREAMQAQIATLRGGTNMANILIAQGVEWALGLITKGIKN